MAIPIKYVDVDGVITKADDERTIEFVASYEAVDRDGELILVDGLDISDFMLNPKLLLQHESRASGVGVVQSLDKTWRNGVRALVGTAYFPDRPRSNDALADVKARTLRGISIGFQPLEKGPPIMKGQSGVTFTKSRLLEISLVSIPSCSRCLVSATKCATCQPSAADRARIDRIARQAGESAERAINARLARLPAFQRRSQFSSRAARERETLFGKQYLEIADTIDAPPELIAAAVGKACTNALTGLVDDEVRRQLNYARGRVD